MAGLPEGIPVAMMSPLFAAYVTVMATSPVRVELGTVTQSVCPPDAPHTVEARAILAGRSAAATMTAEPSARPHVTRMTSPPATGANQLHDVATYRAATASEPGETPTRAYYPMTAVCLSSPEWVRSPYGRNRSRQGDLESIG